MSTDFWSRHIPPGSPKFRDELEVRVGAEVSKGLTPEQILEFERIISSCEDDFDDFPGFVFDVKAEDSSGSLIDRVLYDKYPNGNWRDDSLCYELVQTQGLELDGFELKKELASSFWIEKNSPNCRQITAKVRAALYKEFGHGRVYFHPDLSRTFREAILSLNADRIRAAFKKQKPCALTAALGNRLLSRDALQRFIRRTEKLAAPSEEKSRTPQDILASLLDAFEEEIRRLEMRIPAAEDEDEDKYEDKYKDHPGDKRLAEAITESFNDETLVKFTRSVLEADAKGMIISDAEDTSLLRVFLNHNRSMLKLACNSVSRSAGGDDYPDIPAAVLADLQYILRYIIDTTYGLSLKSGREEQENNET
jgi:hypothetical protein